MSPRYQLLQVAKAWRLTPGQFRALPYEEQIEMTAEYHTTNDMNAYDAYLIEKKAKAKTPKGK